MIVEEEIKVSQDKQEEGEEEEEEEEEDQNNNIDTNDGNNNSTKKDTRLNNKQNHAKNYQTKKRSKDLKKHEFEDILDYISVLEKKVDYLINTKTEKENLNPNVKSFVPFFTDTANKKHNDDENNNHVADTKSLKRPGDKQIMASSLVNKKQKNLSHKQGQDVLVKQVSNLENDKKQHQNTKERKKNVDGSLGILADVVSNADLDHESGTEAANNSRVEICSSLQTAELKETIRQHIHSDLLPVFDSIDISCMYENRTQQKIVCEMIETPSLQELPYFALMEEIASVLVSYYKLQLIFPLEDYDVIGILQKWKKDGFASLNNSHLLILNILSAITCRLLQHETQVSTKDEQHRLKVYHASLKDLVWLRKYEDIFFNNSLLYYQSISMFPDGLYSVQGILCLIISLPLIGVELSRTLMLSTAIRIAQDFGLHSELFLNATKNTRMKAKKKRIWWFCCFADKLIARKFCRPCMILDYTTTVKFEPEGKLALLELVNSAEKNSSPLSSQNTNFCDIKDDLVKYILDTDGAGPLSQYYFDKLSSSWFSNQNFCTYPSVQHMQEVREMVEAFLDGLPNCMRDLTKCANLGDNAFFIYLIHSAYYDTLSYLSSHIPGTSYIMEYDIKKLEILCLMKKFKTWTLFQEMESHFILAFLRIYKYTIGHEVEKKKYVANFKFLLNFLDNFYGNRYKVWASYPNPWMYEKITVFKKLMEVLKDEGVFKWPDIDYTLNSTEKVALERL
ncbi:uncharacterized protein SCODWIG_00656 [Saccharomycodes ludwigii]|uniref:Xylanolytic transcriptional activator regulatory domain-containing protein n=1 Tax=Saccharomycodes ludwigii TaxID=36035 RepID=A0A376B2I5_9ASCO|nr:hypothetical protein SCDLUD_004423 [Saccharomycodes ludwigii]KAH3899002.1 hypothetical protein SCDLUD_004423 [Saccharomycodes ludwigii]SSD58895.1 uncharacterized protein SCODWIG_00656 [Saccharomycodes ludwigii]